MIIYTGGTFDLFHSGHVQFLKNCRKIIGESGKLVVSLNTDEFVERFKGRRPVYSLSDRISIVGSCRYVTSTMVNHGNEDSKPAILEASPDFVVVGSDWANRDYYGQMDFTREWLDEMGILLIYIPYTPGVSSTIIRGRIE